MTLERIGLPGVGVSHLLTTRDGVRLAVVVRPDGCRDLAIYDPEEPDRVAGTVLLCADEAHLVADVLHPTVFLDHVGGPAPAADVIPAGPAGVIPAGGAQAVRIRVPGGSAYAGRPLATPHGADIVAVIRGGRVLPHPDPALDLRADDVLLAVGSSPALARLHDLLAAPC
ncbi:cation:proton antiporter regulatory subunit [Actinoplanes xinjiangensis]|uniref:cation:proton antiporter regulatory subunit n=1 Tax=Actinoplanes xinjiangensis TaxID=512350 RepID=UPI00342F2CC4